MTRLINSLRLVLVLAVTVALLAAQRWPSDSRREPRLPSGKSQSEAILKMEYKKNLEDAGDLLDLAEQLKAALEKDGQHVLSLDVLKKTEEIEKLAKRIRNRLKK